MPKGKLKYSEPIITRVKLDPEQAVLGECRICKYTMGIECRFDVGGDPAGCKDIRPKPMAATACWLGNDTQKGQTVFIDHEKIGLLDRDMPS